MTWDKALPPRSLWSCWGDASQWPESRTWAGGSGAGCGDGLAGSAGSLLTGVTGLQRAFLCVEGLARGFSSLVAI